MKFTRLKVAVAAACVLIGISTDPSQAVSRKLTHPEFGAAVATQCDIAVAKQDEINNTPTADPITKAQLVAAIKREAALYGTTATKLAALRPAVTTDKTTLGLLTRLLRKEQTFLLATARTALKAPVEGTIERINAAGEDFALQELELAAQMITTDLTCEFIGESFLGGGDEPDATVDDPTTDPTVPTTSPSTTVPASTIPPVTCPSCESTTTIPTPTTTAAPAPATGDVFARLFTPVAGYTYIRQSEEDEKQLTASLTNAPEILKVDLRTIVENSTNRPFGILMGFQMQDGIVTPATQALFLQSIAQGTWTPAPAGKYANAATTTAQGLDMLVAFQGNVIAVIMSIPTPNQTGLKTFTNVVLNN